jgi:aryl sulfotransferase
MMTNAPSVPATDATAGSTGQAFADVRDPGRLQRPFADRLSRRGDAALVTNRGGIGRPNDDRKSRVTEMRYQSSEEDSGRWDGFPFRQGDIVISTRSKSGTTWMQMICALLVFQTPDLPAPLATLSPWLDWLIRPRDAVVADLEAQRHRRFIKTHTPLDGIPIDPRASYIVVARHPLDMAVSLFHQGDNLNRERMAALLNAGHPTADKPAPQTATRPAGRHRAAGPTEKDHDLPGPAGRATELGPAAASTVRESLLRWIDRDAKPADAMDSLAGVMWHLSDAWRRRHDRNILLVHYADLVNDLEAEMRRIAERLDITVPEERWPALVKAAGFAEMQRNAANLVPDPAGILKDRNAFFRRGSSGAGRELLTDAELAHYEQRAAAMAPADLLEWLHR